MKDELTPIQDKIYTIRGKRVMLDSDLACLYEVKTKQLNQAVKRNLGRFPNDFMFRLTAEEWANQRSHFVTFNSDSRKFKPYAFTEQGVAMLASVLSSQKAIDANIQIMRAFIQLRNYVLSNETLSDQIMELRKLLLLYTEKNDKRIESIIIALNNLIEHPPKAKPIGFKTDL